MNLSERLAARRAATQTETADALPTGPAVTHADHGSAHPSVDGPAAPSVDFNPSVAPPHGADEELASVRVLHAGVDGAPIQPVQAEHHDAQVPRVAQPRQRARYVDPYAPIKRKVHDALLEVLGPSLYDARMDDTELETRVRQTLQTVLDQEQTLLSASDRTRISNEIADEILGYGPLEPFLRDRSITEIMVNGHEQIYIEREGRLHPVHAAFNDENHLRRTIDKIVGRIGRRVDEASPMVDARLPDGSRVNAVINPVTLDGAVLTIRKFAADPFTVQDLINFGTMTPAVANLVAACVRGRLNIMISGGTGSGKTTSLNVVSSFVPEDERIITIEDAAEL
ncbi:MAG TPA: ATPase, T2SS/T4P/T4SS family, partial [Chloroflexota bacterium]|nr:ATPase, T2SS/T4P/T4SS family [Chloroflexota bacterium]